MTGPTGVTTDSVDYLQRTVVVPPLGVSRMACAVPELIVELLPGLSRDR
jgi:hypothetical protein